MATNIVKEEFKEIESHDGKGLYLTSWTGYPERQEMIPWGVSDYSKFEIEANFIQKSPSGNSSELRTSSRR